MLPLVIRYLPRDNGMRHLLRGGRGLRPLLVRAHVHVLPVRGPAVGRSGRVPVVQSNHPRCHPHIQSLAGKSTEDFTS